jgi:hypothetical protein
MTEKLSNILIYEKAARSDLRLVRCARGRIIFLFFFRAPRARAARALKIRQINSAILKVPDAALIR